MKHNTTKKDYVVVKFYESTGKIAVEEINETNFHPSAVGNTYNKIGGKDDYLYTICEKKNLIKTKEKFIKEQLRGVVSELSRLIKLSGNYTNALNKLEKEKNGKN